VLSPVPKGFGRSGSFRDPMCAAPLPEGEMSVQPVDFQPAETLESDRSGAISVCGQRTPSKGRFGPLDSVFSSSSSQTRKCGPTPSGVSASEENLPTPEGMPTGLLKVPGRRHSRGSQMSLSPRGSVKSATDSVRRTSPPILKKSASMRSLESAPRVWHNPLAKYRRQNTGLSQMTKDSTVPSALESADGLRSDSVCGVFSKVELMYALEEKLGEGSFGTVWRARSLETGEQYAVKHIALTNERSIESAGQELNMIKRLSNPYIVRLHHIVQEEGQLYLVIDLCTGGDLCQYMHDYWDVPERRRQRDMLVEMRAPLGLPWQKVAPWAWQTMVAVAYLHHNRIIHRDIKAANFMLQDDREGSLIKLIDFGYAARYRRNELMDRQVGTVRYMPPEVLEGAYTEKYDVWSSGVVIFLMTLNKYPYGGSTVDEMIRNIQLGRRRDTDLDWADVPKGLQSLISSLMTRDFRSRPSAKDVLRRNGWLRKMGRPKSRRGRGRGGQQPCCSVS